MPTENKAAFDNVLEDKDPAICFVKAYARKPLGVPVKKSTKASNAMDSDWEDDWYGDEYDNYGDYDDFSDSEGDYYDDEDNSSVENDEDSSEDDSSEEDSSANEFDYDFDAWAHHPHAQYFDLAKNQQGAPTPAPSSPAVSSETEESSELETSEEETNAYNQPMRRRRRRQPAQARGRGRGGRRSGRHPTAGEELPQKPHGRRRQRRSVHQPEPLPMSAQQHPVAPAHVDPAYWPDVPHSAPRARKQSPHPHM